MQIGMTWIHKKLVEKNNFRVIYPQFATKLPSQSTISYLNLINALTSSTFQYSHSSTPLQSPHYLISFLSFASKLNFLNDNIGSKFSLFFYLRAGGKVENMRGVEQQKKEFLLLSLNKQTQKLLRATSFRNLSLYLSHLFVYPNLCHHEKKNCR